VQISAKLNVIDRHGNTGLVGANLLAVGCAAYGLQHQIGSLQGLFETFIQRDDLARVHPLNCAFSKLRAPSTLGTRFTQEGWDTLNRDCGRTTRKPRPHYWPGSFQDGN
jgi:hypothetical protein